MALRSTSPRAHRRGLRALGLGVASLATAACLLASPALAQAAPNPAVTNPHGNCGPVKYPGADGTCQWLHEYDKGDRIDPELKNNFEGLTCTVLRWSFETNEHLKNNRLTRAQYTKYLRENNQAKGYLESLGGLAGEAINISGSENLGKRAQQCGLVDPNPKAPLGSSSGFGSSNAPYRELMSSYISSKGSS
ncbi:hypothetical protein CATYP_03575 [Corynebacterium atypicum]|uniref:Uncharacterized protein n=1 Tax=Corynebacterium atypicum TaxID=191610 RepID=A0ABM5QM87_9CORY|nr:hypothetical protein [Corynebacterium atypicum]AIG63891.1 hypothetical protein CATYP_03575 [Corynebacterium atypicum]